MQQIKLHKASGKSRLSIPETGLFPIGHKKLYFPVSILILCIGALYWPVFSHKFLLNWDDQWVVINYYTDQGLKADNLWNVLTEFYRGQYAPVNEFHYILLYSLFGYSPFWFHTASLLIHMANVVLLYLLINKLLTNNGTFETLSIRRISFFTALLMAIHPFLVEAVAWLSASKILLYSFFYLISLHCYLRYASRHQKKDYLLCMLFFIISFGAKEQAITLPVCLLLFDYALGRNLRKISTWAEKIPFLALSLFFGIVTMLSQRVANEGVLSDQAQYPFYQNVLFACYTVVEYLIKCVVPLNLSYIYPFPIQIGEELPWRFWFYPFIIVLVSVLLYDFWRQKWVFFGISLFLIHIMLVSNIIPLARYAIVADRYVYVSSIGIFFLISFLLNKFMELRSKHMGTGVALFIVYIAALSLYTSQRVRIWRDSETLKMEIKEQLEKRADFEELKKKYK